MKKFNGFRKNKDEEIDGYEQEFLNSSDEYIAKVEGKRTGISILIKSLVVVTTIALSVNFASCTLTACEKKDKDPQKTEQTKTDDEKENNGIVIVNPGEENGNNENGNQNGNGEENGENGNSGENNENGNSGNENGGENSGENGEGQEDPNNTGENGGENQGENGNENGGENGSGDPENPNQEDPNQGGQENPQPEQLDFSGLEAKLEEIAAQVQRKSTLTELILYTENEGQIYFAADISVLGRDRVIVYRTKEHNYPLKTQEEIQLAIGLLDKEKFEELVTLQKTSSDIMVDDQTYSKDGIEGDNPFARQCGVENAWMTYVSNPGLSDFNSRFGTGYSSPVEVLLIYEFSGELRVEKALFHVESYSGYTSNKIYENLLEGNAYEKENTVFSVGKNLKDLSVAEAGDWKIM